MKNKKSFANIVYMFAALYAILGILFMLIKPSTANPKDTSMIILGFIGLFVFIGLPVLAVWYYNKEGYQVSLGKAIKLGVLIGLLGGFIIGIYAYVYYSFINPDAVEQTLEISKQVLEDQNMSEDLIENQMEIARKLFIPMHFFGQIFTGILYGIIGGVLGGLFFKTSSQN